MHEVVVTGHRHEFDGRAGGFRRIEDSLDHVGRRNVIIGPMNDRDGKIESAEVVER